VIQVTGCLGDKLPAVKQYAREVMLLAEMEFHSTVRSRKTSRALINSSWGTARGGGKAVVYNRWCVDASDTTAQPLGACDS